jgi:type I restriction enzyme S subunit
MSEVVERGNREKQGNDQLPDGWVWTTLGDVCQDPQYGWTTSASSDGNLKLLRTTDITSGKVDWDSVPFCEENPPDIEKYLLQDGDIVVSRAGSVGYSHHIRNPQKAIFASYLIRFKPLINISYVALFLKSPFYWKAISEKSAGIAIPNVNATKLRQVILPLPSLPEQKRIVEAIETQFTRLDAAVKALERAQIKLERYRASVLQAACEGRLVPTEAAIARHVGEDRDHPYEPADQLLERILVERRRKWEEERWEYEIERAKKKAAQAERKAAGLPYYIRELEPEHWQDRAPEEYEPYLPKSDKWKEKYDEPEPPDTGDLPVLPEGWCWATVDQVSVMSQYGTSDKAKYEYSGIPVLRMGNIQGGQLDYSDLKRMPADWSDVDKFILQPGDLLFNRTNSAELVGKTAIYEEHHPESVFASYLVRVKTSDYLLSDFLSFYINSILGREYINSVVSQQVGQANVNATKLSKMTFALPPLSEQHRIVAEVERRLSVIDALEQAVATNLTRAERMRQAILKKAFEGRLVEQRSEDVDAQELLKRIKSNNP